ncbi:UDP-N-acetylmuramyl-tripeptide synthetase [Sulfuricella denitrificans skB26]|uniref:UDP-N-acetylmuramoyl-L-alanyl-D-glutamate--2,6-diaminopimelate ligase n=1 Tax=Sulfuricella denitrificans (strain DSM 22764 / NBRC 105220 / skB26) TaxID=1163617 RepID=S6B778_SULDS|nr:UDP-N-acetylmuramoyl-L-alanyl-D-glutamate--2,6-diaminopimelate ligase [Sulfuricella denitrificans]BAN36297.1 UDP-N-acetylmuramyl-tripeptide synthetase [Sulfuricella denitrificans skB26]
MTSVRGEASGVRSRAEASVLAQLATEVKRLVVDSRQARQGDTFAAYPGERQDGRKFIAQAVAAGANAVLWEREGFEWDAEWEVPNLPVDGLRDKIGEIASQVYGEPSRQMWTIGITGTNGKTSCCHWIAQCLSELGRKTAMVGTLGNGFFSALAPSANTTPDAVSLHALLRSYLDDDAKCAAMEVSSHGLAQGRVNGVHFDIAVLTNLSRDHLDYHGDMASYAAAKAGLFSWPELQYAVLNMDDPFGVELAGRLGCGGVQTVGYSLEGKHEGCRFVVLARDLVADADGIRFKAITPWGTAQLNSRLLGRFNASNLLAALAVLLVSGIALEDAVRELGKVESVDGRMQRLGGEGKPLVVVDYAHTPDALEKVLGTLREIMGEKNKLICVFGCGGERDRGKRPLMGEVASRLADSVIVTSDNPRGEDAQTIIDEIIAGMGANYRVIDDRAAAIDAAVREAQPDDVVLIAGKGHEDYQEIKGMKLPFADADVARQVLSRIGTPTLAMR